MRITLKVFLTEFQNIQNETFQKFKYAKTKCFPEPNRCDGLFYKIMRSNISTELTFQMKSNVCYGDVKLHQTLKRLHAKTLEIRIFTMYFRQRKEMLEFVMQSELLRLHDKFQPFITLNYFCRQNLVPFRTILH